MHTELEKKKRIDKAFDKLKQKRSAKKAKVMGESEKEVANARASRQFYVDKIRQLHKTLFNAEKFDKLSQHELQEFKQRLNAFQDSFDAKCFALNCIDAESDTAAENEEIEALYILLNAKLAKRIDELKQPSETVNDEKAVNDPNQSIEKMDAQPIIEYSYGQFTTMNEWHSFAEKFTKQVHDNDNISTEKKYEMLKQACRGCANDIVTNAGDYAKAWQQLTNLYGEAYMQLDFCIAKMTESTQLESATAGNIEYIKNRGARCVRILKDILKERDFDYFVAVMMANKLDPETARAWERHRSVLAKSWADAPEAINENRSATSHIPSWKDFENFLQSEIDVYRKYEIHQNVYAYTPKAVPSTSKARDAETIVQSNLHNPQPICFQQAWSEQKRQAPDYMQCTLCDGIHARYKCDVYIAFGFVKKWTHIREEGLCKKCLQKAHGNTRCSNKASNNHCPACWEGDERHVVVYHNSTLCPVRYGLKPGHEPLPWESNPEIWDD